MGESKRIYDVDVIISAVGCAVLVGVAAGVFVGLKVNEARGVTLDLSTPLGTGRAICAILKSGRVELMGEVRSWSEQVSDCNFRSRVRECGGAQSYSTFGCSRVPEGKKYDTCTEEGEKSSWRTFATELSKAGASCTVDGIEETYGSRAVIGITSLNGTRDKVELEQDRAGQWRPTSLFLVKARLAALDAHFERALSE